jgi:succinate dehydrogenase / fumarate reductase iron-sulfur subunit
MSSGGYVSVSTGQANEANSIPIPKEDADAAFESATCIGCGACVASCKNSSAMLFVGAKVTHLALLPQGKTERSNRALNMVSKMDDEGFGGCTNTGACEVTCPKNISTENIVNLNKEYIKSNLS